MKPQIFARWLWILRERFFFLSWISLRKLTFLTKPLTLNASDSGHANLSLFCSFCVYFLSEKLYCCLHISSTFLVRLSGAKYQLLKFTYLLIQIGLDIFTKKYFSLSFLLSLRPLSYLHAYLLLLRFCFL